MPTPTEDQLIGQCETLMKLRNQLFKEIDSALNPVCNADTALKATELLIDQLAQWQRTGRQLQAMADRHHRHSA